MTSPGVRYLLECAERDDHVLTTLVDIGRHDSHGNIVLRDQLERETLAPLVFGPVPYTLDDVCNAGARLYDLYLARWSAGAFAAHREAELFRHWFRDEDDAT